MQIVKLPNKILIYILSVCLFPHTLYDEYDADARALVLVRSRSRTLVARSRALVLVRSFSCPRSCALVLVRSFSCARSCVRKVPWVRFGRETSNL